LYYIDPSTAANPALKPEEALSYEAGYKFKNSGVEAELVAFRRETNNLIDYYRPTSDSTVNTNKWAPRNILSVDFYGIESSFIYSFKPSEKNFCVRQLSISYNFIEAGIVKDHNIETRYALTALRHQLISSIQLQIFHKLSLNFSWRYLQRQNAQAYQLLDAKLNFALSNKVKAFAELNNISNTKYVEAGFVQMPGRWARLGCTVNVF
jgi:vitamin B12 transporter